MKDYTKLTLGELMSHEDENIRRNAISIFKLLQKKGDIQHLGASGPGGLGEAETSD